MMIFKPMVSPHPDRRRFSALYTAGPNETHTDAAPLSESNPGFERAMFNDATTSLLCARSESMTMRVWSTILTLTAAVLITGGCIGDLPQQDEPLEDASANQTLPDDDQTSPPQQDEASSSDEPEDATRPSVTLSLEERHRFAVQDDTLHLDGTLQIHEQATGTLDVHIRTPDGWNATTDPEAVTLNQADPTPIKATVKVPKDAQKDQPTELALVAETQNGGTIAQTTFTVTVTDAYTLTNFKEWSTPDLDILIIPPIHGPIANTEDGPLPNGAEGAAPGGAYLDATLHVLDDWAYAVDRVAENETQIAWLTEVSWDVRVISEDEVTIEDVQQADIVKVYTETTYPIGGASYNMGFPVDCLAYSTMWNTYGSFTYEDMYHIAGHELLHCFGMSHPEDHDPEEDIMSYETLPLTELRCPSNLNVWAMASAFQGTLDTETGPDQGATVRIPQPTYEQHCAPDSDPR